MKMASKTQVLIVDDQPTNIKVLSDLLVDYGFEVLVAKSGENALQKLQRVLPDIILLDVLMPVMDGFETCRRLKQMETTQDIPVIFMTALSDPVDKVKGLSLGAVDYVTKPLQHEEIIARINVHLRLRNLTRELEEKNFRLQEEARSRKLAESALTSSEEKFSKAFRSNPGPMLIMSLVDQRLIEVNQNFCNITGYPLEEVLGRTCEALNLWADLDTYQVLLQTLNETGMITHREVRFRTKTGDIRIVLLSAEVIHIQETPCMLAMTYDITECKKTASELIEKEQFLRSLYEGVAESIFVVDVLEDGGFRYVGCNPAHDRLIGYSSRDIQGKTPAEVFPVEMAEAIQQRYETCLRQQEAMSYEECLPLRNQTTYWMTRLTPLWNEQNQLYRIVGISTEITALKQTEIELAKAKEAAEAASRAKSIFLANMSHELRTPLNAILGFAQLLNRDQSLAQNHYQNLHIIIRSGEHLLAMINDVLDMSKIEADRATLRVRDFNFRRLLSDLESMFRLQAISKNLYLQVNLADDSPENVCADDIKLRQVLINLLSNAIKFTNEGGVTLRVCSAQVDVERDDPEFDGTECDDPDRDDPDRDYPERDRHAELRNLCPHSIKPSILYFEVEDTGCGIEFDQLDMLFEAFTQLRTDGSQEGTGLGLAISQKFVELMGGQITVNSQLNQGSVFRFDIPVGIAEFSAAKSFTSAHRVVGLTPNQPCYRLLVVDDRPSNRQLLVQWFQPLGFEVSEASNGQEAIQLWETWQPHLIWMDVRMPVMDGYEATRQIRAREADRLLTSPDSPRTTIVAITVNRLPEERSRAAEAGCDDYIGKPFQEMEIFDLLQKHLHLECIYEEIPLMELAEVRGLPIPQELATLPEDWRLSFYQATLEGYLDVMLGLIDQIRPSNARLASQLTDLVNNFEYQILLDLLSSLTEL